MTRLMSLEPSSIKLIGHDLFVLPYYGHGWKREDVRAPASTPKDSIGPEPFRINLEQYIYCDEHIVGLQGKIVSANHSLTGCCCVACLRRSGQFNFGSKPGHYMIWITENTPSILPNLEKAIYEWVSPDRARLCIVGYGVVAEGPEHIQELMERTVATRKRVLERAGDHYS